MGKNKGSLYVMIGLIAGLSISGFGTYAATNYAINSSKIEYVDNSGLGVDNVQAAIDGTCTKFSSQLKDMRKSMYPIGSVYISTTLATAKEVNNALGGTWEAYADGKVLRSSTEEAGKTGGSESVKLTTNNLPEHTHSFTPSGSVSSTFTGTAVNTSASGAHNHSFSGTTSENGNHNHAYSYFSITKVNIASGSYSWNLINGNQSPGTTYAGSHSHTFSGWTSTQPDHTHSVTAAGSVSSTFTGSGGTTGSAGKNADNISAVSVLNPYITVYMYKRTA